MANAFVSGQRNQGGIVLIEALVAILIFSVGVLGIIGLQAVMATNSAESKYRAEAGFFVNRLLGQMASSDRATTTALNAYATGGAQYNNWYTAMKNTDTTAGLLGLPGAASNAPTVVISAINNATGKPTAYDVVVTVFWQAPNQPVHRHVVSAMISAD